MNDTSPSIASGMLLAGKYRVEHVLGEGGMGDTDNVVPVGVAVDADNLYWSTDGTGAGNVPVGDGKVFACPIKGCAATGPIVLATGNLFAGPVTVDDKAVYWVEFGGTSAGRVRKVAKP